MAETSSNEIWRPALGASEAAIQALLAAAPVTLPSAYVNFLRRSNGGEGNLVGDPGWIQFWRAEDVLEYNRGYEVETCIPGVFAFGSNGGGELLGFDTRAGGPFPVVMVPFIPMEWDEALEIATDFETLCEYIRGTGTRD